MNDFRKNKSVHSPAEVARNSIKRTPAEVAREAFKQMAMQSIMPTPDHYQTIYNQIAGIREKETLNNALTEALKKLPHDTVEQRQWINRWEKILMNEDWAALPTFLSETPGIFITEVKEKVTLNDALNNALEVLPQDTFEQRKWINRWKKILTQKDWAALTPLFCEILADSNAATSQMQDFGLILREMLRHTFEHGLIPSLQDYPKLKKGASEIMMRAEQANELKDWHLIAQAFGVLMERLDSVVVNEDGLKQDLVGLLKLLIDNISELVADDQWVGGHIALVQEIISGPLERTSIKHAEDNLKEVIFKQGALKNNLTEAKESFKNMIATFVDRLGYMASSSITYQEKIENFSTKLAKTDDVKQINSLLENLMKDTYSMQTDIAQSSSELMAQREQFEETQQQISKLQEELSQLSEKISEDPLTGLLNRRGLDEAMVREVSRAHREGLDLCVALIDIDNFKVFNDQYGHSVGDAALLHLAKVMQETLRATDVPARFGGEEFVVLLPNTSLDYAVRTIERLQQVLTERFFSGNNQRLLITFSAGVALFNVDEAQDDVIMRADQAMYLAKETGKNQVKSEIDLLASQKSAVAHTI